MGREYNNQGVSNGQSSLSEEAIIAEKAMQDQKEKLKKKYRNISFALIGVIVLAVVALLMTQLNFSLSGKEESHDLKGSSNLSKDETEVAKNDKTGANKKEEISPKEYEWSEWVDELPEYVTDKYYSIEEQILYRSRDMNVRTSSENDPEEGWILISTEQVNPRYTEWSEWSVDKPNESENRSMEKSVRYRIREKEECTMTNSEPDGAGWVLESSTSAWSDWSDWGDWTTDILEESEGCEVETKQEARYTCDCSSSFDKLAVNMVAHASQMHGITEEAEADLFTLMRGNYAGPLDSYMVLNNAGFWYEDQTMYRCRTRKLIETNYFYRWSNWSDWSESAVVENAATEVESAIFYRYRDCEYDIIYHFGCWSDWSEYTPDVITANDIRQVETITQYRFKLIKENAIIESSESSADTEATKESLPILDVAMTDYCSDFYEKALDELANGRTR